MKTSFLLGAGFSKHAGMPLANDFVKQAQYILDNKLENAYVPSRSSHNLQSLINFREFVSIEERKEIRHIEDIIELADRYRWIELGRQGKWINIDKEVRDAIYEILIASPFIIYLNDKNELYKIFDDYLRFLLTVVDSGAPVATLNYDPLLELLLDTASMSRPGRPLFHHFAEIVTFDYKIKSFSYRPLPKPTQQYRQTLVLVYFRLHGASNWEGCEQHGLTQVCDPLKTSALGHCTECNMPTRPLIIYPIKNKKLNNQLLELWVNAFKTLEQTNQIIVIGCQFNETDREICEEIKRLIKNGIRIVIIDPQGKEIKEKIAKENKNVVYVDNGNGRGSMFEEVFCESSTAAKDDFQEKTSLRQRKDVRYFQDEQPHSPFFQVPIEK